MSSHVQVITQWNVGETTFTFDISKFKNFYKNVNKIEIVAGSFCDTAQHGHFANRKKTQLIQPQKITMRELE